MKNTSCQRRIRPALFKNIHEMFHRATATRCNDRYRQRYGQFFCYIDGEPFLRAVMVHRGQQDLSSPPFYRLSRPIRRSCIGPDPAAIEPYVPFSVLFLPCIDGQYHALTAKLLCQFAHQPGPFKSGSVHRYLICPALQQDPHILYTPDPTAHGKRDIDMTGDPDDQFAQRLPFLIRSRDIQEYQLIGALLCIQCPQLDRITGIADILEIDPLDRASVPYIQTGYDPFG